MTTKLLISIDPGYSTGVALFDGRGTLIATFTSMPPHDDLRSFLRKKKGLAEVVAEQGPLNRRQAHVCAQVEAIIKQEADDVYWIRPTQWKPNPSAKLNLGERDLVSNIHERDAARMGRCFIENKDSFVATQTA